MSKKDRIHERGSGMLIGVLISSFILVIVYLFVLTGKNSITGSQNVTDNTAIARDQVRTSHKMSFQAALTMYQAQNGEYPMNAEQLVSEGLLKEIPKDPQNGKAYEYSQQNAGKSYLLCIQFEKKEKECIQQ